ncbi:hypothetical protein [Micromonospora carbonacea]|uniref:hypothetical protein n=1 Tax=Micromonospora carbonacea TaxID=47853 RepID=UPI0033D48612
MTTTEPTTALDLDAIRQLIARSTDGPWTLTERQDGDRRILTVVAEGHGDEHDDALVAEVPMSPGDDEITWRGDAELIAAARALLPACADEIDRLRAAQATAPGQAKPLTADINLNTWAAQVAASHRYYEAPQPDDDRDRGLVEWVVMALGNPEQEGAREVLAVLAARHGLELAPTGPATPTRATALQVEPGNNTFVVWYDPNQEPYAVYFRSDANAWDDGQRWFNADQMCGDPDGPSTWDDLCGELTANNGPHLLTPAAPIATAEAVAR